MPSRALAAMKVGAGSASVLPSGPAFPGGLCVLMAAYHGDRVDLFRRAVASVVENTLVPDQFVLVRDGPVPPELQLAIDWAASTHGVEVVALPKNVGLSHALNAGLGRVRTEWVARADADDVNVRDRFATQAVAVEASADALDLCGGAIREFDEFGVARAVRRTPLPHSAIVEYAKSRNPFNHMTVVFRVAMVRAVGGYPHVDLREDYALWVRMLAMGARAVNVPDVLVEVTAGSAMFARRGGLRNVRAEVALQRFLVREAGKPIGRAVFDGVTRSAVFSLPTQLRAAIYYSALRSQP